MIQNTRLLEFYFKRNVSRSHNLIHCDRDKIADILHTTFWNAFPWMKMYEFRYKISVKIVPKGPVNNIPALAKIMAWRRPSDKSLSEPIMVSFLTHICTPHHKWVEWYLINKANYTALVEYNFNKSIIILKKNLFGCRWPGTVSLDDFCKLGHEKALLMFMYETGTQAFKIWCRGFLKQIIQMHICRQA